MQWYRTALSGSVTSHILTIHQGTPVHGLAVVIIKPNQKMETASKSSIKQLLKYTEFINN